MWLGEWKVISLNKKVAPSVDLQIPKEVERKTREGLMHVAGVTKEAAQLDAHWLKVVEWKPRAASNNLSVGSGSTVKGTQSTQSLRGFFSRLAPGASNSVALERAAKEEKQIQESLEEDLMGDSTATIFLHVNKATVRTLVDQSFSSELEVRTFRSNSFLLVANWGHIPLFCTHFTAFSPCPVKNPGLQNNILKQLPPPTPRIVLQIHVWTLD